MDLDDLLLELVAVQDPPLNGLKGQDQLTGLKLRQPTEQQLGIQQERTQWVPLQVELEWEQSESLKNCMM